MLQKNELKQPRKIQTAKRRRHVVIFIINVKESGLREREADLVTATGKQHPEKTGGLGLTFPIPGPVCYLRANKTCLLSAEVIQTVWPGRTATVKPTTQIRKPSPRGICSSPSNRKIKVTRTWIWQF